LSQLLSRLNVSKEYSELIDTIIRNAKKLQKLTEKILDITKIESGSLHLQRETFDLNNMIEDLLIEYERHFENNNNNNNKRITFERVYVNFYDNNRDNINSVFITADKSRISQIFSNLIENSIKFIDTEGTISVTIEKTINPENKELVVVSVKDTGTGIHEEILPNLFAKFTTKSFQGTGLGLYISKKIIEAHGGRIWAQNNPDCKGATFSFSLPHKV
jgi:signal transduction histidine kinase